VWKWTEFGALGAGVGAALGTLCCLPFAPALGAGIAAAGAALSSFQPYLALASVTLLLVSFVRTARSTRCEDGGSCGIGSKRRRWLFLAAITLATLLLLTFPYWSAYLISWSL